MRALIAAIVLAAGLAHAQPDADVTFYTVKPKDELPLVAAELYGDRNAAIVISAANKMQRPRPLRPGERLRIPKDRVYVTKPGDTFDAIALALLGDGKHAALLADVNKLPAYASLTAGTEIVIPVTVQHVSQGGEPIATIALAYYGDNKHLELLRTYNGLDHDTLDKNEAITVPLPGVRLVKHAALDAESQQRRDKQAAARDAATGMLQAARDAFAAAEFRRVIDLLAQPAIDLDYLDPAMAADVGVLLGKAYLATGDDAKALDTFQRAVRRKPDHVLSAFADSPKVRDAWKKAGGKVDRD